MDELVPTEEPLTVHTYVGVPPLVTAALNVTEAPAQIVVLDAVIEIVGTTNGFTVIVIVFDVAVATVAQVALEVNTQLT